jgi:hypothetical protein
MSRLREGPPRDPRLAGLIEQEQRILDHIAQA